jgi:hypothetical protein
LSESEHVLAGKLTNQRREFGTILKWVSQLRTPKPRNDRAFQERTGSTSEKQLHWIRQFQRQCKHVKRDSSDSGFEKSLAS